MNVTQITLVDNDDNKRVDDDNKQCSTSTSEGTHLYPHMPTYVHTPRDIPQTAHL